MLSMMKNKKSQITRDFIYGIVTIFGLGILSYFAIEYAIVSNVQPIFANVINQSAMALSDKVLIAARYDQIIFILRFIPFAFTFVLIVWMVISIFRREAEQTGYY